MPISALHKRKLSRNLAILAALFCFCALIWMITMVRMARADEIVQCGTPAPATLDTAPAGRTYCDIYTRQLGYAEENIKYRAMLRERQENFIEAPRTARRNYESGLENFRNGGTGNPGDGEYNP